ncbi:serine/arginine repetitive matrix protein 3-like [Phalacrocorax carbo]|uniref:serine/arginine repetitive matrix protein 3-like n=1 Tax=Phalacrocorax carbo TaxID=9209 RepID=UPI003119E398
MVTFGQGLLEVTERALAAKKALPCPAGCQVGCSTWWARVRPITSRANAAWLQRRRDAGSARLGGSSCAAPHQPLLRRSRSRRPPPTPGRLHSHHFPRDRRPPAPRPTRGTALPPRVKHEAPRPGAEERAGPARRPSKVVVFSSKERGGPARRRVPARPPPRPGRKRSWAAPPSGAARLGLPRRLRPQEMEVARGSAAAMCVSCGNLRGHGRAGLMKRLSCPRTLPQGGRPLGPFVPSSRTG